jgi:hypothetical protein
MPKASCLKIASSNSIRAEKFWDKKNMRDTIRIFVGAEQPNEDGIKEYQSDYQFYCGKVANVGELEEVVRRINNANWVS